MNSPQMALYPSAPIKRIVEALAAEDGRSTSQLLLKWVKERPEVQERLAGT